MSWEWWAIHNLVLPLEPEYKSLKAIPWEARLALHYFHVMRWCEKRRKCLKDGFIRLGPIRLLRAVPSRNAVGFFDLRTFEDDNE